MFPDIKGNILHYDVIVIGHQRANVYFGDDPRNPPRGKPVTCTSTMIRGIDESGVPYELIIDPTTRNNPEEYYFEISRRTGLHPEDITHCFCTHEHFDHVEGLAYFPNAKWLVGKPNLPWTGASMLVDKSRLTGVEGEFLPGLAAVPLPGHTNTLHGIAFRYGGKRFIVAGDAVVSKYHFAEVTNNFEDNAEMAVQTQNRIKQDYDVVIPGHDNLFLV